LLQLPASIDQQDACWMTPSAMETLIAFGSRIRRASPSSRQHQSWP